MIIKKVKKVILLSTVLTLFFAGAVFAFEKTQLNIQPQNDFVVEPGKTEIFINPGETITKHVSVTNRIGKTVKFKLSTEDIVGTKDANAPVKLLGDETGPYSLKNFIKPEVTEFELADGEKISLAVEVSVPIDAEPRGY